MLTHGQSWKSLWRVSEHSFMLGFSSSGASYIDFNFDSKLTNLNAQLESAIRSRQYIDAESVSKILNNIKSSLDRAIRDLTVHSVSQSLGTAEP